MDGVVIINKPAGMTSHDVVARVRRILNERSVGHLGTLDPSATGVLPLVVGRFTRLASFYNDADKRYEGVIRFGVATDTYDADGNPVGEPKPINFSLEYLQEAAAKFTGKTEPVPPPFSAKKIAGIPAYKLARKNQDVKLEAKPVEIKELEIVSFDGERAVFKSWVSSGTYLRSLAHDLGRVLETGAHLESLTRTAVREFCLNEAHSLEELQASIGAFVILHNTSYQTLNMGAAIGPEGLFIHPRLVLPELPAVTAPPEALAKIRHGNPVNLPYFEKRSQPGSAGTAQLHVRVFENQVRLIAIARRIAGTLFHPKVVMI